MIVLKIILLASLIILFLQDLKDRSVWFFLPYVQIVLGAFLFYKHSFFVPFLFAITTNLIVALFVVLILFLTSKYILKKKFYNNSFGLADILIYIGLAVSFPTISFIVCFVGSLLFTITLYFLLRVLKFQKYNTVPLAGSIALFLASVYVMDWFGIFTSLYII